MCFTDKQFNSNKANCVVRARTQKMFGPVPTMNEYMMHRMSTVYHTQMSQFLYHLMPYTTSNMHQFMHILFQMIFTLAIFVSQYEKFDFFLCLCIFNCTLPCSFSQMQLLYANAANVLWYILFECLCFIRFNCNETVWKKFSLDIQELQHVEECVIVAIDTENESGIFFVSQPKNEKNEIYILLLKINTFTCTHICQY